MHRPTRQEQAQAILGLKGRRMASRILGRSATTAADFEEAFNLERIDLLSEMPTPEAMLALAATRVGPKDGLYVLDDGDTYRVYVQERGETYGELVGVPFQEARNAVIDRLIMLQGLPYSPPG
jgi:inactivated superfamily I helicase